MTEDSTHEDGITRRTLLRATAAAGALTVAASEPASAATFTDSKTKGFSRRRARKTFDFSGIPTNATSDVTVIVTVEGDYAEGNEFATVSADGDTLGRIAENTSGEPSTCVTVRERFFAPRSKVSDGTLSVEVANNRGVGTFCDPSEITVEITYDFNDPPTADAGGPYTVNEGDSVTLDGTGSSDPDGSIDTYRWDLDGDGSFEVTGETPTFDASGIDGTTDRTVRLTVIDDDGASDTDSTTVTVENVAPSVSADNDPVVVDEGQTATNTGTYSDPVDSVTLSASRGTVTKTGGGNWEWSFNAADEDDSGPVTITADDGEDTTEETFQLQVDNVAPTVSIDSLPDSVDEGEPVSLTASFTDPGPDDTHTATVDWGDGTVESVPVDQTNDTLSATHTYDDDDSYTVTVTVEDDDGGRGTASDTVNVEDVCVRRRRVSRGQEDEECPSDRIVERGGSREGIDRETDRNSDTRRRDRGRGRGSRRGR